jgi:hypothetical protein
MTLRFAGAAAALLIAGAAHAAPTTTAIGNVNVLGTSYAVSLLYDDAGDVNQQSFDALLPSITFTNASDALAAATALRDTFGASFDWVPASSSTYKGVRVAYDSTPSAYDYFTVSDCCSSPFVYGPFNAGRTDGNYFSFAQFTTTAAVPEPETYALMFTGLGLLAIARRRAQRQG